jgi:2-polyprenyl-3-methyl-5-hydroxy-6-metoxy-1,4-benzoquinol methylase
MKTWSTPIHPGRSRGIPCALCGQASFRTALVCEGFSFVRCRNCGLLQANPQPIQEDIASRYRELHGEDYLTYELANEQAFLNLQLKALSDVDFPGAESELFKRKDRPKVLDVGCATGALLEQLRNRGWDCCGVELCTPSAEYARKERGLEILDVPLEKAGFQSGSIDVLHASHLIEHLNDPAGFLAEARRILSPGGYLFLTTPNSDGFQSVLFGARWRSAIYDHLYLFSRRTLSRMLAAQGFLIEAVSTWGGLAAGIAPAPIKKTADAWAKRLGLGDVMILRARHSP